MSSIELFGLALEGENYDYKKITELGLKIGYIIDQKCSTKEVYDFLLSKSINTSSTFYKNFGDVISKDRFELYIDQIKHYISTYGSDFQDKPYIPNDEYGNISYISFSEYKTIKASNKENIIEKCNNMLSGVALSKETIDMVFSIYDRFNYSPEIKNIKNKEALCMVYDRFGITTDDCNEFTRFLIYKSTNNTLLIKDKKTLTSIEESRFDLTNYISSIEYDLLSQCFLRHKSIFLAFKKAHRNNKKIINKLRNLAKKNHNPMKVVKQYDINLDVDGLTNFKKVSIMEGILNKGSEYKSYIIRNGRFWIDNKVDTSFRGSDMLNLYNKLYTSLVKSISQKYVGKKFYIPKWIDITVPTSEKTFVGNFPLGTRIKKTNNTVIGIYRKGEDGARDLDLSLINKDGGKIGWNSSYNKNGVVYSGDITSADPDACEMILLGNTNNAIICVNIYSGEDNSKYKFFIGESDSISKNKMIDNILIQSDILSTITQQTLGLQIGEYIVMQNIKMSNKSVSNGNTITESYIECYKNKNHIYLRDLLLSSGLIESNKEECDIDLSNLSKDTILSILQ